MPTKTTPRSKPARSLDPRREPVQDRSKRTVRLILDTTATLLIEVGLDGLTTNRIAERAGIPVRSLYRYFPNKNAVILELGRRFDREWSALGDKEYFAALADPSADWRAAHRRWVLDYVEHVKRNPGSLAFRRAMRAAPELIALLHQWNLRLASDFAKALETRGVTAPRKTLEALGVSVFESAGSIFDLMLNEGKELQVELLTELLLQSESHLARHLEPGSYRALSEDPETVSALEADFRARVQKGLDCSAFEADSLLAVVREVWADFLPRAEGVE